MAAGKINLQKASGGVTSITGVDGVTNTEVVLPESGNLVSINNSVTDNAIARYDGTTGKLQNSGVIIDDNGNVGIGTSVPIHKLDVNGTIGFGSATGNGMIYTDLNWGCLLQSDVSSPIVAEFGFLNNAGAHLVLIDTVGNLLLTRGTGALGYGIGAGGTVTQLTSKSTNVTLNKPNGIIIMNNAALASNTWAGFAVINSTVAGSDIIIVNAVSGSTVMNLYEVKARPQDGSIAIDIRHSYPSSLTDAIAIKFTVIKGANS